MLPPCMIKTDLPLPPSPHAQLAGRTIRVDHVEEYKVPKMTEDMMPEQQQLALEGCAPQAVAPSASPDTKEDPPLKEGKLALWHQY